jgi:hypothetical protein
MRQSGSKPETLVASTGSTLHENCPKLPLMRQQSLRNIAARDELARIVRVGESRRLFVKE